MREDNQRNYSRTLFLQLSWFPCSLEGCGPGAAKGQDVLERYNIKPSEVATHDREITRRVSEKIYDSQVDGFLWWSSIESKWKNATLFKSRAEKKLKVQDIIRLNVDMKDVKEAARFLNIKV